ncbi:hypothetical protein RRG08_020787 [Elysia crispata]|uniref:Uncharacterized protein n=1 Tax=Elysia crispata TaxID=231223 RepID=A0AAE0ZTZ9_9GAST|nr:hypothetical protein RRG08_020787 [Elysia crispata]
MSHSNLSQDRDSSLESPPLAASSDISSAHDIQRPFKDLGSVYREKYSVKTRPNGLYQMLWCRMEMILVYLWVLMQTLCLLVGLTVLHFTTFSAIICYLVNGVARGRRELLPHRSSFCLTAQKVPILTFENLDDALTK